MHDPDVTPSYVGDEFCVYEMPYGCEIIAKDGKQGIVIQSKTDAKNIIASLTDFVK